MIRVVAVGKLKMAWCREGAEEYLRRAGRFAKLELIEVSDGGTEAEGQRLLAAARGGPIVACDERGESWTSHRLAAFLSAEASPCFLIGGPDGLDAAVREGADCVLSLGAFTLPHELARVVLLEQIYRALTLRAGHPYHR